MAEPVSDNQAVEIDMASGAESPPDAGEIDIPSLDAPEFGSKTRSTFDDSATDDMGDGDVEPEIPQTQRRPGQQKKKIQSPEARARILEREKKLIAERDQSKDRVIQDLQIKVDRLYNELSVMLAQQQEQEVEPEEEIDPELDPIGAQAKEVAALKAQIERAEAQREMEAKVQAVREATQAANTLVQDYVAADPEVNEAAMRHLASVIQERADKVLPNLTSTEKAAAVAQWIAEQKVQWIANGIHPGEMLINMAYEYGFNPEELAQSVGEYEGPQEDPGRREIAAQRERQSKTNTIAGVVGKAPNRITGEALKQMDNDTFNRTVDKMIKAGAWTPNRSMGKTPPLSSLLPGKGIKV